MERERLGIPPWEQIALRVAGDVPGLMLYNDDGTARQTVQDFQNALYPPGMGEVPRRHVSHQFTEPTYIPTSGDPRFPRVRLASASCDIEVTALRSRHEVTGDNIVAYILEDVLAGTKTTIDRELRFIARYVAS